MKRFKELCEERGYDPALAAIKIMELEASDIDAKARLDANLRLMEFIHPKQRAVEHSGEVKLGLAELLADVETEWQGRKSKD